MAGNGGKRENSGRKAGSKDRIIRPEIEKRQPAALKLVDELLKAAKRKDCTVAQKADIARTLLPYLLPKQPQILSGDPEVPIAHTMTVIFKDAE